MLSLALAAAIWVAVHIGIAGSPLRAAIAARLGDNGFRGLFSLISLASITLLIMAYRAAPHIALWATPPIALDALAFIMLPASMLFFASIASPNPTAVGQDSAMASGAHGVQRITRHPMLWSFALWGAVHMLANGTAAGLIFFGAFTVTALAGMRSIDRKLAARHAYGFMILARESSVLPGAALVAGRTRLVAGEIKWWVLVGGFVLWILLIYLHPRVIGLAAVPS